MNSKKTDRELIEEIYSVLFGNPDHQTGLIARVVMLEKAVRKNTKLQWVILGVIIASGLGVLFR